jgi:ABC-type branched-subunit amino acid transport system permease subunit
MADQTPPNIIKRLVVGSLGLLLAAWAIQTALQMLASVWWGLVIAGVIAAAIVVLITWLKLRRQKW